MSPWRFFLHCLAFGAIIGVMLLLASAFGPHASRVDYHGGVIAKHVRLNSLPSPKVIVIGGSSATFGIDSEVLEQALCMPVVNMSIHASLGFRYMVEEVKGALGEGDLVIAILEHSAYHEPARYNDTHVLVVDRAPEMANHLPMSDRIRVRLDGALMRLQGTWKIWSGAWKDDSNDPVYRSSGFNERGDLISHLGRPPFDPAKQAVTHYNLPTVAPEFWRYAQMLADSVAAHHGTLVFIWPAHARSSHRPEVDSTIAVAMREHGYPMLGRSADYVQADTAFHDTHYHLRSNGRQLRTARLVMDLCKSGRVDCCADQHSQP